jgi:hypothetical protein
MEVRVTVKTAAKKYSRIILHSPVGPPREALKNLSEGGHKSLVLFFVSLSKALFVLSTMAFHLRAL